MSKLPFLDLTRFDESFEAEACEAFRRVLRSGQYILGPEVAAFEQACAEALGVEHAIGVSSGTDALLVALMALGIGAGDEVVCPTYTFFATAGTVHRTGARAVFADIDLSDFNSGLAQLEPHVSERTKAIVVVHLFGQCTELAPLAELCAARGIALIEDAAQAFGASDGRAGAGTVGDFGCFSFFPSKNLGGFGDAGLVTTRSAAHAERARILRTHGGAAKYHHHVVGGNFRIDALQAALLMPRLRRLEAATSARITHATAYAQRFAEAGIGEPNEGQPGSGVLWPTVRRGRHIFNQYCLRVPGRRDALRRYLAEHGVPTQVYYPVPLHLQPCFAELGYEPGALPSAERAAAEALALPIFPELSERELDHVAERVIAFFRA